MESTAAATATAPSASLNGRSLDNNNDSAGATSFVGLPLEDTQQEQVSFVTKEDKARPQFDQEQHIINATESCNISPMRIEDEDQQCQQPEQQLMSSSSQSATNQEQSEYTNALEQRVNNLEEKIATLSKILQRQLRRQDGSPTAYRMSPPRSPLPHEEQSSTDDSFMMMMSNSTPAGFLDSPPPQRPLSKGNHVRNLSFRVLHSEEFAHRTKRTPDQSPMLPSSDDEGGDGGLTPDTTGGLSEELPTPTNSNLFLPDALPGLSTEGSKILDAPKLTLPKSRSKTSVHPDHEDLSEKNAATPQSVCESTNGNTNVSNQDTLMTAKASRASTTSVGTGPETSKRASTYTNKRSSRIISATSPFNPHNGLLSPSNSSSIKLKWLDYLNSVQESNYDTDKQMEEFVKVPSAVEALLSFGFWICVDSFLYTLTILPIRFVWSSLLLLRFFFLQVFKSSHGSDGPFQFHRRHAYQIIQMGTIFVVYQYVLKPIDISILYHWIRVQSMVKLYLLIAIVEVFDRLMCSLGQDCLDSLYWNTTRRPWSMRLYVSILVVLTYAAVHSILLFIHVATINVAMNSDDQALLSLLIGGNFAEIKSTVFKKYNKASLFKITATDICERFKLALFLVLVLMLNLSQGMDKNMIYNYLSMCIVVWCAEWLSDWIKHAFITKSNFIASGVYSEYALLLAGDNSGFGHEGENLDHSHAVVKRLGFSQIPLVCVMAKYVKEAYKYGTYDRNPQTWMVVLGVFTIWSLFLVCKMFVGSTLLRISRDELEAAPEFSKTSTAVAKKKS
ncbi:Eukaryotic membrane protein family-domain containing protein [Nitzschia inconspicua]|uniref:Eukaryotic membrane protein family-domain containing protein n=1 Tax=Nitzschia inconspicua TaxID=303405 RepID=A0A9K3KXY3_9STRA|nr:Eukaryotic membrane protein family-domain containing protein [Nitzschia inconspicua]